MRQRDLAQQAAAKTENIPKEQPANRVTFSQEAQTRLNEEKTHIANQVQEVRDAAKLAAAVEHSKAMREEHQRAVEARVEDRNLKTERDRAALVKAEIARKAVAGNRRVAEEVAAATEKVSKEATAKAIELRTIKADEVKKLNQAEDMSRTIKAQDRETSDLLEKQKSAVVVKNREASQDNIKIATEHSKKVKTTNERVKAETAKAMKMYQHVDTLR
ncbi:MAG: hypothetical protein WCV99_18935 [Sterolibacterium sp.]